MTNGVDHAVVAETAFDHGYFGAELEAYRLGVVFEL